MHSLDLLDCTLRDGSYVVDFQFTAADTAEIAAALEAAGMRWVEIGHGLGLRASSSGRGRAAATDEEYLRSADATLRRAKWGMFFIPGIGTENDLELAAKHNMHFVRIGTNVTEVRDAEPFIRRASDLGLHVSMNLMKSYALGPEQLAEEARRAEGYGADLVCVVDSAGCMLPEQVSEHVRALRRNVGVPIGFHGHNNLDLAVANALAAIDAGAQMIDTTLRGIGRGGGNVPTEVFLSVLHRRGVDLGCDVHALMDVSERLIRPFLRGDAHDPLNVVAGVAGFHSSYLRSVLRQADEHHVDPRDLIREVSRLEKVSPSEALIARVAAELRAGPRPHGLHTEVRALKPASLTEDIAGVAALSERIHAKARKTGRQGVLNVVAAEHGPRPSPVIQEEFDAIIGSVEVASPEHVRAVARAVDGIVDILLVDTDRTASIDGGAAAVARAVAARARVVAYSDRDTWVRAVARQLEALVGGLERKPLVIIGADAQAAKLALLLAGRDAHVRLTGAPVEKLDALAKAARTFATEGVIAVTSDEADAARGAIALVAFRPSEIAWGPVVDALAVDAFLFDAGIGCIPADAAQRATDRGFRTVRPDMRAALAGELSTALGTHRMVEEMMGRGLIDGVPVVAGGLVGKYGDVVVDSLTRPTKVFGVADGRGRVLYHSYDELAEAVRTVEQAILRYKVLGSRVV